VRKSFVLGAGAIALTAMPAFMSARAQDAAQQKFPTPPPPVTAENSIIGPAYADPPEAVANPAVPQGDVHEFILYSEDSKIYPGIVRVQNMQRDANGNYVAPPGGLSAPGRYERHVYVYVPKQLQPGTPAPFMVVQDGRGYVKRMVNIMDNMIAAKRLPPMVLVFADSGGSDAQGSERGLEYDTVSERYSNWVEQELLPAVTQRYGVTFTTNPDGRGTVGGSSGAAAAFTMAWFHPERYHKVLSYSGTFVNQAWPVDPATPRGAWEYHDHLIAKSAKKPIRIWMEVGEKDNRFDNPEATWHNWPLANNRMADVLKKKGYDYRYVFAMGAGHVDGRVVMQTLPAAMEWLWRDFPK
jgi:enterochelin esterase family protein